MAVCLDDNEDNTVVVLKCVNKYDTHAGPCVRTRKYQRMDRSGFCYRMMP